jgi:hypothetical protein
VSARADLFHRLVVDAGLSPHWADRQIDNFAHELAEQQRAHADDLDCYDGALYDGGQLHSLPDLIDPEAQRASTEGDKP